VAAFFLYLPTTKLVLLLSKVSKGKSFENKTIKVCFPLAKVNFVNA